MSNEPKPTIGLGLEGAWKHAEILGFISVDSPTTGWHRYKVTISFHRRCGSFIQAVGLDDCIEAALRRAINEAGIYKE